MPRKASASSNAALLGFEWFVALATWFSPSDPTEPDSHHHRSILWGSQPILCQITGAGVYRESFENWT